jgi:endogenous inhibitor of DNA gyrase (YacG/DUF329 family)
MKHRCPICKKIVSASPNKQAEEAKLFPFCSQRCKLIDLGAWLDAEYKITSKTPDTPSDGSSSEN